MVDISSRIERLISLPHLFYVKVMLMVQAVIDISERTNRIISIVKDKYGLRNESEAINLMAEQYEEEVLELELRPEYVEKMKKRQKESTVKIENFKEHFGLE
jgi:hypothetical protein